MLVMALFHFHLRTLYVTFPYNLQMYHLHVPYEQKKLLQVTYKIDRLTIKMNGGAVICIYNFLGLSVVKKLALLFSEIYING